MQAAVIEGGIYFLLFFMPFAFGGVEVWALGVLQIVTAVVLVAWAWKGWRSAGMPWHRGDEGAPARSRYSPALWIPLGLFTLLILFQLVPLPPTVLRILSPATHHLYSWAAPGYAEGRGLEAAEIPASLLREMRDRIPPSVPADPDAVPLREVSEAEGGHGSGWRPLSIYPFRTRRRLLTLVCYIALFAAIVGHYDTRQRLSRLVGLAVSSGLAVTLMGIFQKLSWNEKLFWMREGTYVNPFGPYVNRNHYAAFAGLMLPIAICIALASLRQRKRDRARATPPLLFYTFAAVVLAGGIFYSLSRGGMVAAGLSTAVVATFVLWYGARRSEIVLLGALLVIAVGFLAWIGPEEVFERVGTISTGPSAPSLALRFGAWQRSLDLIGDFPILGTGFGTFRFAFMPYAPAGRSWWTSAHNEFIEVICDTGLLGGMLFLWGFVAYVRLVACNPDKFSRPEDRYLYAGLVAGLAAILLHSAISASLQMPANGLALTVVAAALLCLVLRPKSSTRTSSVSHRRHSRHRGIGVGRRRRVRRHRREDDGGAAGESAGRGEGTE